MPSYNPSSFPSSTRARVADPTHRPPPSSLPGPIRGPALPNPFRHGGGYDGVPAPPPSDSSRDQTPARTRTRAADTRSPKLATARLTSPAPHMPTRAPSERRHASPAASSTAPTSPPPAHGSSDVSSAPTHGGFGFQHAPDADARFSNLELPEGALPDTHAIPAPLRSAGRRSTDRLRAPEPEVLHPVRDRAQDGVPARRPRTERSRRARPESPRTSQSARATTATGLSRATTIRFADDESPRAARRPGFLRRLFGLPAPSRPPTASRSIYSRSDSTRQQLSADPDRPYGPDRDRDGFAISHDTVTGSAHHARGRPPCSEPMFSSGGTLVPPPLTRADLVVAERAQLRAKAAQQGGLKGATASLLLVVPVPAPACVPASVAVHSNAKYRGDRAEGAARARARRGAQTRAH